MRNQSSFNSKNVDCRIRNYGFGLELDSTSERQALVHHSIGVDACLPACLRAYSPVVVVILNSGLTVLGFSLGQHSSASLTGASLGQTTLTYV
ncbi:hypothetical protein T11_1162, partial [Trichinella zimbabwensis]